MENKYTMFLLLLALALCFLLFKNCFCIKLLFINISKICNEIESMKLKMKNFNLAFRLYFQL